jgi:Zn-dependent protease with chaperone function
MIVGYYAVLFVLIAELLNLILLLNPWPFTPSSWIRGVGVLGCLVLVSELIWHLLQSLHGLLTPTLEGSSEKVNGIMLPADKYVRLHELVARVARRVCAPIPDRLWLSPRAVCYGMETRRLNFTTPRRLVLVLGLPHLEVMTAEELKAVLAHELTHFRGGDTRLHVFLFRFLRSLEEAAGRWNRWSGLLHPVYWLCQTCLRLYLRAYAPLWRYHEIRADRWSAFACGGDIASRTLLKDQFIQHQFDTVLASRLAGDENEEDVSVDQNIYRSFATSYRELSRAGEAYLLERLSEDENAAFWDSHPTTRDRIGAMRSYPDNPSPAQSPARDLIPSISQLEDELHTRILEGA